MSGRITAQAQTVIVKPGEDYKIAVCFEEMEPCKLRYELTDYDSGTITPEGEYTAPGREGTFEIRVLCDGNSDIGTYLYVDVRK